MSGTLLSVGNEALPVKLPQTFPTGVDDSLALGLDLGVGSCGQALVYDRPDDKATLYEDRRIGGKRLYLKNLPEFPHRIAFLGVRAFDVPETREKTGIKLKNPERRQKRGLRRTTRRRAWRMWQIRKLLKQHGLLPEDYPLDEALWKRNPPRGEHPALDKWRDWHSQMTEGPGGDKGKPGPLQLRVKALDERIEPLELAAALLHLAKHRGFRSNRKSEAVDSEGGKVLKALASHQARRAACDARTHGEMLLKHPDFSERKRNREGVYTATALRKAQEEEIQLIFKHQRGFGNASATSDLEKAYLQLFNEQKPLQNPVKLLGSCPFENGENRGPRLAPSFELSRALQKLNTLSIIVPGKGTIRLADHVNAAGGGYNAFIERFPTFGSKSNPGRITWKDLRMTFQLPEDVTFPDLPTPKRTSKKGAEETVQSIEDLEKEDFCTRSNANGSAKGSHLLLNALGTELYTQLAATSPEQLDHAAFALTFFEQIENDYDQPEYWGVLDQMRADQLDTRLIDAVEKDLRSDRPTLAKFAGTTSMSTLASRKLVPLLRDGTLYSDACSSLYEDHRQTDFSFDNITNPVVKSVVREALKQVVHLIDETGKLPGRIIVEIGRDLGKSVTERNEMSGGLAKRTKNRNANRNNLENELGRKPDGDELLRYELWLEQSNTCPYCGETLCGDLTKIANSEEFEIDHILPRSRSHDNSYENKVLVHRKCNRDKSSATPFEFSQIGNGDNQSPGWLKFTATIAGIKGIRKQKRRNLLNTTFAEGEARFAARHLNDTRYISKLVTHYLHALYEHAGETPVTETGGKRRVFVQPGPMTSLVRKAWGLEDLKKDRDGRRLGDKHHAIDALICAMLSEGQRQFITLIEQEKYTAAQEALSSTRFVREYQLMERKNDHCRTPRGVKPPWSNFRHDVVAALDLFTVSRRENRRGRGSLHNDTLYRVEIEDGNKVCYSRKSIIDASLGKGKAVFTEPGDIDKIKDIHLPCNQWLKDTLTAWIDAGSPVDEDQLPRDPQGAIIRKVTMSQGKKSGRHYPQGYVSGGDQVRVDVFSRANKQRNRDYFFVPVYSYHLIGEEPPNGAIVAYKDEDEWDQIDDTFSFEFSLWPNSRFELKKKPSTKRPEGEHVVGLYAGVDRSTGAFSFSAPDDSEAHHRASVKSGTLLFRKLETDRLGREFPVKSEKRTWRGRTID